MIAREIVATVLADADMPPPGGDIRPIADAVSGMIYRLDERAGDVLRDELPDDPEPGDEQTPELAITDMAGRAITAARLEREPGTNRFTILLQIGEGPAGEGLNGAAIHRDLADWMRLLFNRCARLERLVELATPAFLVSNEAGLIRQAVDAIEGLAGDRITADAIRAGRVSEEDA